MIEVLVALIIITVGLLGLANLQGKAQKAELEAYQRAQALILLQDIVSRIKSNRQAAGCYAITDAANGAPALGTGNGVTYACAAFGTTESRLVADADMAAWDNLLKGAAETSGGSNVGAMIGARGCVSFDGATQIYTASVAWQGLSDTVAPGNRCGQNAYGAETKRRVVSQTFRIAVLN